MNYISSFFILLKQPNKTLIVGSNIDFIIEIGIISLRFCRKKHPFGKSINCTFTLESKSIFRDAW